MVMPNQPRKGTSTKVEPIRRLEDIRAIKNLLQNEPRNLLLFTMGINNGLRIGDLLQLKVRDIQNLKVGDVHRVIEQKTGKENILLINKSTHKALRNYLEYKPGPDEYLFRSQRDKSSPITVSYANQVIKKWCKQINLTGNYGTHTLRKTFGYIQRVHYGVGFEILCKRFNHSSPTTTMRYLGIENKEVNNILMNDI
ncbi:integrase family protein [Desulfonatronospira thiodismutans ASO3-1]|uniref:Integrase family protein n=1 Tax=Desulfonatronospira thiodismutans ASO3-1 TaxID=555779 RepID=D6SUY8_9BACT|nr:site-specific integrase [Desulfonatronospira thiodismutans]EFI32744.1 integrase family protein [Desulfonatronospira thiodismutans ASO3-1]